MADDDRTMRAGDCVALPYKSANNDERYFNPFTQGFRRLPMTLGR